MGFLDRLKKSSTKSLPAGWKELTSLNDLDTAIKEAESNAVVFFKHSISCGISNSVRAEFEAKWDLEAKSAQVYYLDLINHRDVSNAIAERLDVVHQSPQVIAVKAGKVIYSKAHHSIDAETLINLIKS